jgi:DNA-binding NarL/FixJ family response regulator
MARAAKSPSDEVDTLLANESLTLFPRMELRAQQLQLVDQEYAAQISGSPLPHHISPVGFLSPREFAVLRSIAKGLSAADIAIELFISLPTVKSHTSSLYRKLSAHSRTQALARAYDLGIISSK